MWCSVPGVSDFLGRSRYISRTLCQAHASGRRSPLPTDWLDVRQCPQASFPQLGSIQDEGKAVSTNLNNPTTYTDYRRPVMSSRGSQGTTPRSSTPSLSTTSSSPSMTTRPSQLSRPLNQRCHGIHWNGKLYCDFYNIVFFDFLTRDERGRRRMTHKPNQDHMYSWWSCFVFMSYLHLLK